MVGTNYFNWQYPGWFMDYNGDHTLSAITQFSALVPTDFKKEIGVITPYIVSNEKGATATPPDHRYKVLTSAPIQTSADSADLSFQYLVWTRDPSQSTGQQWTFAQIQLPSNVTIASYEAMNPDGVLTAIGNAGTGDNHVLLLVPMDIEPDDSYPSDGGNPSQTNTVINRDISSNGGNVGSLVDSIFKGQPDKNPQKHYVSPKNPLSLLPSSYLAFGSGLPPGMASKFKWVTDNDGQTILPPSGDATSDVFVERDQASHVTLQIQPKDSSITASDKMNVWVVWANGQIAQSGAKQTFRSTSETIGGNPLALDFIVTSSQNWRFVFTIVPSEIISNLSGDIPDLRGSNKNPPPVPGAGTISPSPLGSDLSGGVSSKWDMSRRFSFTIANPTSIPRGNFATNVGAFYAAPIPNGTVIPLPEDPLIGNDDFGNTIPEDDNPYQACTAKPDLDHGIGQLSSRDNPQLIMPETGQADGTTFEQKFLAQEFVRVQIGSAWYVISDPLLWKVTESLISRNGHWFDNNSTVGPGN